MLDAVVTSIAGGECDKDRGLCLAYSNFSCFRTVRTFFLKLVLSSKYILYSIYSMLDRCLEPGAGVVR